MRYTISIVSCYIKIYCICIISIMFEEWQSGSRRSKVYYSIDRFVSRCEKAASRGRARSPHRSNDPKRAAPPSWLLRTTTASADVSRDFSVIIILLLLHLLSLIILLFILSSSSTTTSSYPPRYVVSKRKYKCCCRHNIMLSRNNIHFVQ